MKKIIVNNTIFYWFPYNNTNFWLTLNNTKLWYTFPSRILNLLETYNNRSTCKDCNKKQRKKEYDNWFPILILAPSPAHPHHCHHTLPLLPFPTHFRPPPLSLELTTKTNSWPPSLVQLYHPPPLSNSTPNPSLHSTTLSITTAPTVIH